MALALENICKSFLHGTETTRAVDGVSLALNDGEFFTLLGPSGCGKTTLLRLIAGLETAETGKILLTGQDLTPLPAHRRPVNTVFQNYALFPHMTVADNVGFGLKMQNADNIPARVDDALRLVRMEDFGARKPAQLSGGQQQRVALARALVNRPRVLLLDEPLSALDYKLRQEMQIELKRLQRDTGVTFILVTHDQEEALSMSDRIAVMNKGKIVQTGTPQNIYARPATRFVAEFIGHCNFCASGLFGLTGGEIAFRPEDASFSSAGAAGKVEQISYRGAQTHYIVRLENGARVTVSGSTAKEGDAVRVAVDPAKVMRCAD